MLNLKSLHCPSLKINQNKRAYYMRVLISGIISQVGKKQALLLLDISKTFRISPWQMRCTKCVN